MLRQGPRRLLKSPKAVVYAVLVHVLVVGLIVVGWQWHRTEQRRAAAPPTPVQAEVVDDARVRAEVERLRQEEQRKQDEEAARQRALDETRRRTEEAERKRQQEEARLEELKRRAAAEERRQTEARQKAEAERKRRAADAEKRKAAAEAERKRAAEQAQAREAAERRAEAERALREQLAREELQREQALEAQALAEAERYKELIRQKVERNWLRPSATAQRLSCVVRVRLAPGGDVLDARVVRSSGNAAFDRSVENAVFKASPLPVPSDGRIFEHFRELEFLFSPKN